MAFQGFAREQGFSNHQIDIDIASVINSDLKEADRQSKFMAKNAQMAKEYSNTYLKALMDKHALEEENRRRNFKFFMENRENINEQIKYNNEIKYKDAGVDRHVKGLDSILGEALLDFAVNAGSSAISKHFSDKKEAKAAQKKETLDFIKLTSLKASKEQNEMRRDPEFIKRLRSDVEGVSKAAIAEYNAAGDHKAGINFAQNVYRSRNLDEIDRQNTFHSERLTAIAYQTSLEEFTWNHNGAEITWSDIQAGRYPNAEDAFLDAAEKNFYEERGIHDVGVGAQARAALGVHSITAQAQRIIKNNQYKRDTKDYEIQLVSTLENHPGTTSEKMQFVLDPNGTHIGSRKTRGEALEWLRNHWENYGSSQQLREAMAASSPGVESINAGAPSARHPAGTKKWQDWNASLAIAVAREEQGRQNTQAEYDGHFKDIIDQGTQGLITPQQARTNLELFRKGGPLNNRLVNASSQVQKSFMEAMRNLAGYGGEAPTITAGQKAVSDQITDKEAADNARIFIFDKEGKEVALDGIPTHRMNSLKQSWADGYRYWANGIADDLIASGVQPGDVEAEINAMIRTDDPRTDSLKKLMQAEWYDPNNPDVRLKVPNFPNMRKPRGKDEKGFIEGYDADRFAAQRAGQTFGYDDIDWNNPIVERWLSQVDRAKRYKHIDLQNVLSNAPQAIKHIMNTQKFSSAGQVYQAALDHGVGYGDKYTRLSESDYMDYNEVQQQYNVLGSQLSKLDERAKAVVLARQVANGGQIPLNATASYLTWKGNKNAYTSAVDSFERLGFQIGGHPTRDAGGTNTYTDTAHSATGDHPLGQAFDITHQTGDYNESIRLTKRLKEALRMRGLFAQIIGPGDGDPDHTEHIHAGRLVRPITKEDEAFIQSYVFGNNKLDTPITYGDTSVTGPSGKTFNMVPVGNTSTQQAQAVNNNEIMQEWLRKVSGMPLPPLLQGGYGK